MMRTELGNTITNVLEMTHSVANLVEYLRNNEIFTNSEPADVNKPGYLYRIGLNDWMNATGIDAATLSTRWAETNALPTLDDGRIWVDFDFEYDVNGNGFIEDEGPRFVFIALDNYNGQFDNDACVMATP